MLERGGHSLGAIAATLGCRNPTIVRVCKNMERFRQVASPSRRGGRVISIASRMRDELRIYLFEHCDRNLEEMGRRSSDVHGVTVSVENGLAIENGLGHSLCAE